MDITGRAHGWKGRDVRCPGCADGMSVEKVDGGDVDVCGACGGIWLDWFDGEPRAIATKVVEAGVVGRPSSADALRAQELAVGACPRCNVQLVFERLQAPGCGLQAPSVMRCESCAGCFVSREAAETIAALGADEPPPPSAPPIPGAGWKRMIEAAKKKVGL